jgi:hypothetical protein
MPASSAAFALAWLAPGDRHRAALDLLQAGKRVDELRLAVAVDARDPDDLAGPNVEGDASHLLDPAVVANVEVSHLEEDVAGVPGLLLDAQENLASDHRARERLLGRACPRHSLDRLAAAQHRDAIRDLQHLVQLVADEDDRLPVRLQTPDDLEQLAGLLGGQHRGWLVEDEQVGFPVERLEDLHALLLADGDVADEGARVDGEPELLGQLAHAPVCAALVEQDAVMRLDPEDDVLGDRHDRNEHEVLVHHPDPGLDRLACRRERDRLPVEPDLTPVGLVQPVEDVHQRRLAGAVLAQERVHFAPANLE